MNENNVAEAVIDFCNALEAAIINLRRQLQRQNGQGRNLDAIKWENKEGAKGPFERSQDVNNPQFKALLKDLAAHNGKLTRNGMFYWLFQNGSAIGRKKARFQKRKEVN